MATDQQLVDALKRAAEVLLGRALTQQEFDNLVARFNKATGTNQQRATEALRGLTNLTEAQIGQRKAASDNTDRIIRDLQDTADKWKPGSK
jgi:FKBP-type peptidyl-prolyl cis-trans isomerase (trigger factor)